MTTDAWLAILLAAAGYLLGSIPFGLIVSKALGAVDPRTAGSRNIGFTNVLRVSGKKAGVLTLLGDLGKGWLAAWLARLWLEPTAWVLLVALSPVLGHLSSIFLKFRGGKGVATALGAVLGLVPSVGLAQLAVWLATAAIWRYSSGAAIAAFALLPIFAIVAGFDAPFVVFTLVISGLILGRHAENMRRLMNGTEPKIGQRREAPS
ncbi:glycerol-3-phosphate 1-O-acyltransferase PlsY [Candidatus Nitrospira bockiana]